MDFPSRMDPIFSDMSRKKSHFSRGDHLSRFWLGVPDLSRFAHICSCTLTHRRPKISSDFICIYEKIAGGPGSAPEPAGKAHNAPQIPKSNPRWLGPVTLAPYYLCIRRSSRTAVPKLWFTYFYISTPK